MSSTVVLGDDTIKPSGLIRFERALQQHGKPDESISLVVEDFAVIDYFPKRMSYAAHSGGFLTDAIVREIIDSKMDWSLVEKLGLPPEGEAIICLFSGTVNGNAVTVATFSEYKSSIAALSIRSSKPFKTALDAAIDQAATDALARSQKAPE